jgi:hypothetical protein
MPSTIPALTVMLRCTINQTVSFQTLDDSLDVNALGAVVGLAFLDSSRY